MESALFLLNVLALIAVCFWLFRSQKVGDDEGQSGLFATRISEDLNQSDSKRKAPIYDFANKK